mmetsp:Transcript_31969/g.48639  ORF Transcript_31969/g.48639 Transcript_31969/m.48639 type:complete len:487 (-) Transcript_31969:72-1532(-)
MAATESTPLVTSHGSIDDSSKRDRKYLIVGFVSGALFVSLLVTFFCLGSFFGGKETEQHSSSDSSPKTSQKFNDDSVVHATGGGGVAPKFIATQFISFTINTIGGVAAHGECEDRNVDPSNGFCYLGNTENITEDVYHRAQILQNVLHKIRDDAFRESPDIDHAGNVLKIVAFPEFYWRGPNGAYSLSDMLSDEGVLIQVSESIRETVRDPFFNDFLFIFGTVIAARSPDDPLLPWERPINAKEVEYYNFAPIIKGGLNDDDNDNYSIVTKRYISGADFLSRTELPNPTDEHIHNYAAFDEELRKRLEKRNTTLIEDNIIDLDGLRIGLEICLDHRVGALWNTLRTKYHSTLVDVLVITSAGMSIERGPNPVVPGGVVYLSDGEASSAACRRSDDSGVYHPNSVCRWGIGDLKHIPSGGPGYSDFFGLTACWDMEQMDLLKGYYSRYQTQGCAYTLKTYDIDVLDDFKYYPPSVEIYPTVAIPNRL